ncbi:MAG TPA: UvrD-helicase domain-containing protein, partial [Thermoanaerobaculia bacterium]|nr:UvrD-helicase domain-containing protein [Thermoanaerobaculia bacterium]
MAKVARDRVERDAIRNDLDVTMLVEAAAGTGKTTNLVKRMVNLVATAGATPSTIAAITFTVKAASHLRAQLARRDPSPPRSGGEGGRRPDEGAA